VGQRLTNTTWMRLLCPHSIPDRLTYDQFVAPTLVFSTYTVTCDFAPRCQRGWAMAAAGSTRMARKVITATSFRKTIPPVVEPPIAGKMLAQLRERRNRESGGPGVGSGPAVCTGGRRRP
jgi:hypothetical protein